MQIPRNVAASLDTRESTGRTTNQAVRRMVQCLPQEHILEITNGLITISKMTKMPILSPTQTGKKITSNSSHGSEQVREEVIGLESIHTSL